MPEKFFNVTNGVTPRRWMVLSNPQLSALITSRIGDRWISNLEDELERLEPFADDRGFPERVARGEGATTRSLWPRSSRNAPVSSVDPASLFDIQVKRLHEYKRQHLNVLYLITHVQPPEAAAGRRNVTPRTVIFGGKAAPGYRMAKLIIKLINVGRRR